MLKSCGIRSCLFALLAAFALSAVLPFFAAYNAAEAETQRLSALLGDKILICTGDSFKWVRLADLRSGKEKPNSHSDTKCPLCYVASHALQILPHAPSSAAVIECTVAWAPAFAYIAPTLSRRPASAWHVRAPPASLRS